MTDELLPYGLGALTDAPDIRDYPLDALYASEDIEPTAPDALPAAHSVSGMPAVLDQHASPMCVAFSTSALKGWQDHRDQMRFFDFDEDRFFRQIGGTSNGAYPRVALASLLATGYPLEGAADQAHHRIAAYFAVPVTADAIRSAILDLGPVLISTPWFRSWFHPHRNGQLPMPDVFVGGHALIAYGWDQRGIRLRNSWGADWGAEGDCWMPTADLRRVVAAWKTADQIVHPIPWVRRVTTTASPALRVRSRPTRDSRALVGIARGHHQATTRLEKFGGRYRTAAGRVRTDWLEVEHGGHRGWIARGYTRVL